jgi:hypothetical protein
MKGIKISLYRPNTILLTFDRSHNELEFTDADALSRYLSLVIWRPRSRAPIDPPPPPRAGARCF